MKKLFSILFSIAFLLVFISLFSQKSFASCNTQCVSDVRYCTYGASSQDNNSWCSGANNSLPICCNPAPAAPASATGCSASQITCGSQCCNSATQQCSYNGNYSCVPIVDTCTPSGGVCTYTSGNGCNNAGRAGHDGSCGNNSYYQCCAAGGGTTGTATACYGQGGTCYGGSSCGNELTQLGGPGQLGCSGVCCKPTTTGTTTDTCSTCTTTQCLTEQLSHDCPAYTACVAAKCSGCNAECSGPAPTGTGTPPAPSGPKPAAPTLACTTAATTTTTALTCTEATATTAKISWTSGTKTLLYYCDNTKASQHSPAVSCTKDARATTDSSGAGAYLLVGGGATNPPQTISGLIAGDSYTAFVRTYNGASYTDQDINFTAGSCTTTTPTSTAVTLTWTNGANTSGTLLYYCDLTKASAHSPAVNCTKGSQASTDGSGWYLLVGGGATNSPQTISGLIAGHSYTAFVRAYNGATSNFNDSADTTFPSNTCGGDQPGLKLAIGLDGIGTTGDQRNPDYSTKTQAATQFTQASTSGSNQDPKSPTRVTYLTLTDTTTNVATVLGGHVTFQPSDPNKGKYTGTVPYGANFKAGTYKVKVQVDGHLVKLATGTITVTDTNTSVAVPGVNLVAGDIVTPNLLDGASYNLLLSCMSDPDYKDLDAHAACNTDPSYKTRADLDDNGVTNKFDYNLFLREIKVIQAGD